MAALIDKPDQNTTANLAADLKRRLVGHLDMLKRPNDLVRVTQISHHQFRVNTLALKIDADAVLRTYHIVMSRFLYVEDRDGELVITDQTRH
jgi:hypothetical protein